MVSLTAVIIGVVALFGFFLITRSVLPFKICVLCAAVALTWIGLLTLWLMGIRVDPVLIAILMGGSVVGLMYLLASKLPERYQLFKLPFYLTGITIVYWLLGGVINILWLPISLAGLWLLALVLFVGRSNSGLSHFAQSIINCCKNW